MFALEFDRAGTESPYPLDLRLRLTQDLPDMYFTTNIIFDIILHCSLEGSVILLRLKSFVGWIHKGNTTCAELYLAARYAPTITNGFQEQGLKVRQQVSCFS